MIKTEALIITTCPLSLIMDFNDISVEAPDCTSSMYRVNIKSE